MKSTGENLAYLPTTIADIDEHGNVLYSQWNYKILCHPLKQHVPLNRWATLYLIQIYLIQSGTIVTIEEYF